MKKLFSALTICIVASLIIMACKKSSNTTSTNTSTSSTTTSNPAAIYGVTNQFNDRTLSSNLNDSGCTAIALINNVGTVSVNNNTLTPSQSVGYYVQTNTIAPMQGKATWQVSGGIGGGAFTYTTVKNIPYFTNLQLSLSSFSKSSNLIITHPIIMADSIKYIITDNNFLSVFKIVVNSSTGITFTPAMMASLAVGNNASIKIEGYSSENSVQGSKNVSFQNSSTYLKAGIVIN